MSEQFSSIIVHGSSTESGMDCTIRNWFPWLKQELVNRGINAIVPQFPTPDRQSVTTWTETFQREFGGVTDKSILIGHSTGAALLLNLLNQSNQRAMATFLVGGFIGQIGSEVFDPMNKTFFENDFDWERVKKNAGEIFVYSGDNDPYVPLTKGIELAKTLSTELILVPGGGHLNQAAGFTTFPRLLRDIDLMLLEKKR